MADMGSCGNACCVVEIDITGGSSTKDAYQGLKGWLQAGGATHFNIYTLWTILAPLISLIGAGGADGSVAYRTGKDGAGHNPGDDVRQYKNAWDFILQGSHTTTGGFVDTLDFNIKKPSSKGGPITLRAASLSDIHGALGDNGQNFKTLSSMVAQLHPQLSRADMRIVHGCGTSGGSAAITGGASGGKNS